MAAPESVTLLLEKIQAGEPGAEERLFNVVYGELRKLAGKYMRAERPDHTLQPTALVNEAYVRLYAKELPNIRDRVHFFALASQAMRRVLVDHARARKALKRGGPFCDLPLDELKIPTGKDPDELLALEEALLRLEVMHPKQARMVELRYFAGLSESEVAEALGVSERTLKRYWRFVRTWLYGEVTGGASLPT
jgi:RNA polymerase sigma factor (TIGR02999 family)